MTDSWNAERVEQYELRDPIGKGGMGTVFRAYDPNTGREVALKLLHAGRRATAYQRRRFRREVTTWARLRHPNIVPLYHAGESDGSPFLVMELIQGTSLLDRVAQQGPLPPREAAQVALKLALALDYTHAQDVFHRDLKPENVLLDTRGEPYLTDFGLAKDLAPSADDMTQRGQCLGTPGYMPLEQANGEQVGPEADVHALGATLYVALTQRLPYPGETPLMVLQRMLEGPPVAPSEVRSGIDSALDAICLKAMARRAQDRYSTIKAMGDALSDYLGEARAAGAPRVGSPPAAQDSPPPKAPKAPKRRRTPARVPPPASSWTRWVGVGVTAAALAALGAFALTPPAGPSRDEARRELARLFVTAARGERRGSPRALEAARRACRLDPNCGAAQLELGRQLPAGEEALRALYEAARLLPSQPEPLVETARQRLSAGDPGRACKDLDRALSLDPRCGEAYLLRARAFRLEDRLLEAQEELHLAERVLGRDQEELKKERRVLLGPHGP